MLEQVEIKALYELKGRLAAAREYYTSTKFPNVDDLAAILGITKKEEEGKEE